MITATDAVRQAHLTVSEYMTYGIENIAEQLGNEEEDVILNHSDLLRTYMICCTKDFHSAVKLGAIE